MREGRLHPDLSTGANKKPDGRRHHLKLSQERTNENEPRKNSS